MEVICPQCTKRVQVSAEELALHGGAVVCPQCLTVFDASGLVPEGTVASRPGMIIEEHHTYGYCPHCGCKIPQGVNYCPYCGKALADIGKPAPRPLDPADTKPAADDNGEPSHGTHDSSHSHGTHGTSHGQGTHGSSHDSSHGSKSHSGKRSSKGRSPLQTMLPYNYGRLSWHSGSEKAGTRFALLAWLVIIALLALLAFIIYKVNLLP